MSKQIIKQVVNGVEKLLIVEVVEEIDVSKVKKEYEQLSFNFADIDGKIQNNIYKKEQLENKIAEAQKEITAIDNENIELEENKRNVQVKLDELTAYINEINNVEQLSLPLEEKKEEVVEVKVEQPKPVFNKPVRRFGR